MIILWFGGDRPLQGADFGALCAPTRTSRGSGLYVTETMFSSPGTSRALSVKGLPGISSIGPPGKRPTRIFGPDRSARIDTGRLDVTLGTVLKYREDQDRVRAGGLEALVERAVSRRS